MNKTKCIRCGKEIECEEIKPFALCDECFNKYYVPAKSGISINCLICSEEVELTGEEARHGVSIKVCDKCGQAVIEMRKQIEKKKQKEKASTPNNICAMH